MTICDVARTRNQKTTVRAGGRGVWGSDGTDIEVIFCILDIRTKVFKEILNCFGFALLRSMIASENSRLPLNLVHVELVPDLTWFSLCTYELLVVQWIMTVTVTSSIETFVAVNG